MTCEQCQRINESFSEKPFTLKGCTYKLDLFACNCGTKWWQYNTVHHLWREVTEETYLALQIDPYAVVDVHSGEVVGRGSDFI